MGPLTRIPEEQPLGDVPTTLDQKTFRSWLSSGQASPSWELIDGVVYRPLATPHPHGSISSRLRWFLREVARVEELKLAEPQMSFHLSSGDSLRPDQALLVPQETPVPVEDGFMAQDPCLAVEVVTPESRKRDRDIKRAAYEKAGVNELWFADAKDRLISVFALAEGTYYHVGTFGDGHVLRSCIFPELRVEVSLILP